MWVGCVCYRKGLFWDGELSLGMQGHLLTSVLKVLLSTGCLVLAILANSSKAPIGSLPAVSHSGQDNVCPCREQPMRWRSG